MAVSRRRACMVGAGARRPRPDRRARAPPRRPRSGHLRRAGAADPRPRRPSASHGEARPQRVAPRWRAPSPAPVSRVRGTLGGGASRLPGLRWIGRGRAALRRSGVPGARPPWRLGRATPAAPVIPTQPWWRRGPQPRPRCRGREHGPPDGCAGAAPSSDACAGGSSQPRRLGRVAPSARG
jgi:hypothetical protein